MENNYFISIEGRQEVESQDSKICVETVGKYVKKGNIDYIIYKEYDEIQPKKYNMSVIKIDGEKCVTVIKSGEIRAKLILEKGKRYHCYYDTEFGSLMVGVFADKITSKLSDKSGELNLRYFLDVNSNLISINEVTVKLKRMD